MSTQTLAGDFRVASWNSGLKRDGPGLLLRDIMRAEDPQIDAAIDLIERVDADVLVLLNFDYDLNLVAASNLVAALEMRAPYTHLFALMPNVGQPTGRDIDGDDYFGDASDAHGYGPFPGQGGIVILSRWPIDHGGVADYSQFLWSDMPGHLISVTENERFGDVLRLATVAAWRVPILAPTGRFDLLTWHAGAPVFDGPEDRNGRRNHDENRFWPMLLSGALPFSPPDGDFILLGSSNLDPFDGEGYSAMWRQFLTGGQVQDPLPATSTNELGAQGQSPDHRGDPGLDTADWPDEDGPGNLRVQYVLPSAGWQIHRSGIAWPDPEGSVRDDGSLRSRHGMVWVDIGR